MVMSGFGMGGSQSGLRFSQTRGRMQGGQQGAVSYPSPFFDVAHTYLPTTVKQMFRWCRYYFLTNAPLNAVIFKMAEYPITDIIFDHKNSNVKDKWKEYFQDHLRYRAFQVEVGLDYMTYGNAFISIGYPFKKYLSCSSCNFSAPADKIRANWQFTNYNFRMTCPRCGQIGDAAVQDYYFRNASGIKMIRWNPEDIEITYNDISGEYTYFYTIPATVRNDIVIGKKDILEGIPQVFIAALREQKGIVFSKDNIFHLRRPTLATHDRGWGIPLLLPVLKDVFYLQMMKKAQEAILLEHIVPLRILFPQAGSGTSDPYCLDVQSLVEVNYGYKPAGEVRKGDLIKTVKGNYQPVTAVKERAVRSGEDVFKLVIAGMSAAPVGPSEDHPFFAVSMHGKQKRKQAMWDPSWVKAKDLEVGDYVAYPLHREVRAGLTIDIAQSLSNYTASDDWVYRQITSDGARVYEYVEARDQRVFQAGELQRVAGEQGCTVGMLQSAASRYRLGHRTSRIPRHLAWSKDFATILGYYLAEGCVDEGRIVYTLHAEETWICDELDRAFRAVLGKVGSRDPHGENGLQYKICDSIFAEFLKNYGGHLAWNKKLPPESVHLPEDILLELVRCLINGDGGPEQVVRDNGTGRPCRTTSVTYTTTSLQLALKLRELLLYLGIIGKVHTTNVRERMKHDIHRVKVNGQMALDLWKKCGWSCPEKVEIKKDTTRSFILGDYAFFRVQKKTKMKGVKTVFGFQVDGDKSFCVPACATHNTTISLVDWKEHVAAEIARWRHDSNYIPILPLPIGNQTIGGDGKALLLAAEQQQLTDQIIMGMGVPLEFLRGGMSYAGTNVSMRMLENAFLGYNMRHKALARWVMQTVGSFMRWEQASVRFKPFKMADDLQRKAFDLQLNAANKISDTTLLSSSDYDQAEENKIMMEETANRVEATKKQQLAMAEIQGEQQLIMMKYQAKAQEVMQAASAAPAAPGEPGGPDASGGGTPGGQEAGNPSEVAPEGQPVQQPGMPGDLQSPLNAGQRLQPGQAGVDIKSMAAMQAETIKSMPPQQQQQAISTLTAQSPELAQLVVQMLRAEGVNVSTGSGAPAVAAAPSVDMRPMPDKLPPRRANAA